MIVYLDLIVESELVERVCVKESHGGDNHYRSRDHAKVLAELRRREGKGV